MIILMKRVTVTLPEELVSEIDRWEANRSRFVLVAAERELEADVRRWLRGFFFTASGDMPPEKIRFLGMPKD